MLSKLERRLRAQYRMAVLDLNAKLEEHFKTYDVQRKKLEKRVLDGKMTREAFDKWLEDQAMRGKQYSKMADVLARDALNANKIAIEMVNENMGDVFAYNANYATYFAEMETGIETSFTLYNRDTVKELMTKDPELLKGMKKKTVNEPKDVTWNRRRFNTAITQGILQGEEIQKIATRIMKVWNSNYSAAVRNARTATTCAQSLGRMSAFSRAEEYGIKGTMMWVAKIDSRTRHSHRVLDGQEINMGEKFQSPLGEIGFPGDPEATDPSDIYNCRCTLNYYTENIPHDYMDLSTRLHDLPDDLTYEDWENMHPRTVEKYKPRKKAS